MTSRLLRVAVRVPRSEREPAIAVLLELVPEGFDEIDHEGDVELGVYTDATGARRLRAVFGNVECTRVEPGWEDGWRAFHRPVLVGGLWVGPPWSTAPPGLPTVVIDPGRAFGTGAHPTTQLCLELLAGGPRGALVDVGCGSGVLSIAAARLGFAPVVAVDVDPEAVEVTRANAALNRVELGVRVLDATVDPLPATDVAVANIALETVELVLARLGATVAVTSGYLVGETPAHRGWRHASTMQRGGWAADRFDRR